MLKKRKVSIKESGLYISAWGNENIIRNHIAYFENKLEAEVSRFKGIEFSISLAHFPNFAAWIRLYTELICNGLYWRLFRTKGGWKRIDELRYWQIRDEIANRIEEEIKQNSIKISKYKFNNMKKAINLVLNLRHSFQHWGLPNPMRRLSYGSDEKTFIGMLDPMNYKKTKKIFSSAYDLIELLPNPSIGFYDEKYLASTKIGKKYHRRSCSYLRRSKIPISLKEACERGYTPCSRCNPPRCK